MTTTYAKRLSENHDWKGLYIRALASNEKDTLHVRYQREAFQDIFVTWEYERKKPFERPRRRFTQGFINLRDKIAVVTKFGTLAP